MKTVISLPDELFESFERVVHRSKRSRDEVYADALREYFLRHATGDEITEAINVALEAAGDLEEDQRFVRAAAWHTLKRAEW
jgi:metal-responsive CopG/Arc/MetJ family transcriptional regulator